MEESDLKKIRASVPPNFKRFIESELGFTRRYINLVLQGKRHNNEILIKAVEMALKNQQEKKYIKEFLDKLE